MVAILQNIRSLFNVGSIFRTADAMGFEKIYLCGITPAPTDRFGNKRKEIAKVALGAQDYVPWEKIGYLPSASRTISLIKKLKKEGYQIIALEQSKKSIFLNQYKSPKNKKIALIVGNEVKGLANSILKHCDKILEIPMYGRKESLNVAVAFGIAAFFLKINSKTGQKD
jgi:tRNA G18 (ribose-2'-O)-methylase SpoU